MKTSHIVLIVGTAAVALAFIFLRPGPAPESPAPQAREAETPSADSPIVVPPVAEEPDSSGETRSPSSRRPVRRQTAGPLYEKDEDGNAWVLDLRGSRGYRQGDEEPGPPIVVKTDVHRRSSREFSIGLVLTGQAGESYRPVVRRNGQARPAPRLKIVNEAGQVLVDDSFRYG